MHNLSIAVTHGFRSISTAQVMTSFYLGGAYTQKPILYAYYMTAWGVKKFPTWTLYHRYITSSPSMG